jgi:hypothetical protein
MLNNGFLRGLPVRVLGVVVALARHVTRILHVFPPPEASDDSGGEAMTGDLTDPSRRAPRASESGAAPSTWPLETAALGRSFGRLVALAGLDLSVEAGECVAVIGANGSGKTTAVRTIAGLLEPSEGSVRVCGFDPHREPEAEQARAALALVPDSPLLYDDLGARGATPATMTLAIVWRDAVAAVRAPGRILEAAGLAGAGTVLCLLNAERPLEVAAAMILVYLGASRRLGPLRAVLDATDRARVLLRPRIGRVVLSHSLVPEIVVTAAGLLAAAGCAIPGALPAHGAAAALAAVAATPVVTWCAAMSARRGGRVPQTLLVTAMAVDPAGGGIAILSWLGYWPTVAAVLGGVPIILITTAGAGAPLVAAAWTVGAAAALGHLLTRDPVET